MCFIKERQPYGCLSFIVTGYDNIARHKSLTGVTEQTASICASVRSFYGENEVVILPKEFQMEAQLAPERVNCPVVDWRVEGIGCLTYVQAARDYDAHVMVIPTEMAEGDRLSLNGNGFNLVSWLGDYEIWADYAQ